jgi:hypothetical protein
MAFKEAFEKWAQENLVGEHVQRNLEAAAPGVMDLVTPALGIAQMLGTKSGFGGTKPWSRWKTMERRHETDL